MKDKAINMSKITLPIVTPSLNELLRMHWAEKTRLRKIYEAHLRGSIYGIGMEIVPALKGKKRKAIITSYRPRRIDTDNYIGGLKILIDAMRDVCLIYDDGVKHFELTADQKTDREKPRTEIYIGEVTG